MSATEQKSGASTRAKIADAIVRDVAELERDSDGDMMFVSKDELRNIVRNVLDTFGIHCCDHCDGTTPCVHCGSDPLPSVESSTDGSVER